MDFLDLIEQVKAENADPKSLFAGSAADGRSIRGLRRNTPQYQEAFNEALSLITAASQGSNRARYLLREALGTADFPLLFGDVIDRMLLADYLAIQPSYKLWCSVRRVNDFRTVHEFAIDGSEATLSAVPPQTEYPESKLSDTQYAWSVSKFGRGIPFAWESIINDDLDALRDIPTRFARAAARTEEKFATALLTAGSGPDATFFSDTHKNKIDPANGAVATNPALSISGLQDAFTVLAAQTDTEGEPIAIDGVVLVVPPSLEITATQILHATQIRYADAAGTANELMYTDNWMRNKVALAVDYYLPIVDTVHGKTSWYVVADPGSSRPAFRFGFLRGHDAPEVFMKDPNSIRVGGGGSVNPLDGDFDTDSIRYKIRHVIGGRQLDFRAAVASNGTGA